MPYIPERDRQHASIHPESAGELNYAITNLTIEFLGKNPNYQRFNDALGAIEGAKLELYRRRVAPYEDTKIAANGDVY